MVAFTVISALLLSAVAFVHATDYSDWNFYLVEDIAIGKTFYDIFEFKNISDPTHGRVTYVDYPTAVAHNITYAHEDHFVLRADSWTTLASTDPGRESARLASLKQYETHVIVADLRHMPQGCATWPAIWEFGTNWPGDGEMDIVEGVNDAGPNAATLHTGGSECIMSNLTEKGTLISTNCDYSVNYNQGCSVHFSMENSYGPPFNAIGGGFFAMEKTNSSIKVWHWPRDDPTVPLSIRFGSPVVDPNLWGEPEAWFNNNDCDFQERFKPANVIINLTLCGDRAGSPSVWATSACAASYSTCVDYVNELPSGFVNAYFDFKSLRIYTKPGEGVKVDASECADIGKNTTSSKS